MANRAYSRAGTIASQNFFQRSFLGLMLISIAAVIPSNSARNSLTNLFGQMTSWGQSGSSSPASLFQPANLEISSAPSAAALLRSLPTYTPPVSINAVAPASAMPAKAAVVKTAAVAPVNTAAPATLNPTIITSQIRMIDRLVAEQNRLTHIAYVRDPATGHYMTNPDGSLVTIAKRATVSASQCAGHAVQALNAALPAGVHIQVEDAMHMQGSLTKAGFQTLSQAPAQPKIGDVVLIVPTPKEIRRTPTGHIVLQHMAVWSGRGWVSDYDQGSNPWPFLHAKPDSTRFTVTYLRNPLLANASDTFVAYNGKVPPSVDYRLASTVAGHNHNIRVAYAHRHHHWNHHYVAAAHNLTVSPKLMPAPAPMDKATVATTATNQREMAAVATAPARPVLYSMRVLTNATYTYA